MRFSTVAVVFAASASASVLPEIDSALAPKATAPVAPALNAPINAIQSFGNLNSARPDQRAQVVINAFNFAFNNYFKLCKGHDELLPVTNQCGDSRNGWGASAVDALTTAIVMRQANTVNEILDYIETIDFTKTSTTVSLFETTIRYLGGMISAYDLLSGPFKGLVQNPRLSTLLKQSTTLADTLAFAFNTPSGVPHNGLNFATKTPTADDGTNGLATVGTLVLEWQRLSDITGNPKYGQLAQKAESYILRPTPKSSQPWDGLLGSIINITNGQFTDNEGGWQGGRDSAYEYLLKMYVYDSSKYSEYATRWKAAAKSSIQHLASHPQPRPDLTYLAEYQGTKLILSSEHLACFDGGNFILGGLVFKDKQLQDFGIQLTSACHNTYTSDATRIGPEIFGWDPKMIPAGQEAFFKKNGFYITDAGYDLRPEVIESYYYAYRATGDRKYQDWAWDAVVAIIRTTKTQSGFSSVTNVNAAGGGTKSNLQESFLFAEVLKYSYLIFAEDGPFQVEYKGANQFVYNTECHPFKVRGPAV